jgi:mRNA degradation ribonuclease J1/J2
VNKDRQLVGEPQIVSRGFVHMEESKELLDASRKMIKQQVKRGGDDLGRRLESLFYQMTNSRPVVLPQYIQV